MGRGIPQPPPSPRKRIGYTYSGLEYEYEDDNYSGYNSPNSQSSNRSYHYVDIDGKKIKVYDPVNHALQNDPEYYLQLLQNQYNRAADWEKPKLEEAIRFEREKLDIANNMRYENEMLKGAQNVGRTATTAVTLGMNNTFLGRNGINNSQISSETHYTYGGPIQIPSQKHVLDVLCSSASTMTFGVQHQHLPVAVVPEPEKPKKINHNVEDITPRKELHSLFKKKKHA